MENVTKKIEQEQTIEVILQAYIDAREPIFSEEEMRERLERLLAQLKLQQDPKP